MLRYFIMADMGTTAVPRKRRCITADHKLQYTCAILVAQAAALLTVFVSVAFVHTCGADACRNSRSSRLYITEVQSRNIWVKEESKGWQIDRIMDPFQIIMKMAKLKL